MFYTKRLFIGILGSLALTGIAQADILAGGSLYGGLSQTAAVCYIYNAGPGTVSITSRAILREPNVSVPITFNGCGATLAAGSSCGFDARGIVTTAAHNCRVVVSPSGADVRGSFEIRNSAGETINNIELR